MPRKNASRKRARKPGSASNARASASTETTSQKIDRWVNEGEKEWGIFTKDMKAGKDRLDNAMKKEGLDYDEVIGIIVIVIGVALILINIVGIILGLAGIFLIYFGLKMLGRHGKKVNKK